jgi:S-adenosylmethionine synthetase
MAADMATGVAGLEDVSCILASQIGRPVDDPQVVDIGLIGRSGQIGLERRVTDIVRAALEQLHTMPRGQPD